MKEDNDECRYGKGLDFMIDDMGCGVEGLTGGSLRPLVARRLHPRTPYVLLFSVSHSRECVEKTHLHVYENSNFFVTHRKVVQAIFSYHRLE